MLTEQTDLQEEFDSMCLLTQYLGPLGPSNRRRRRTGPESAIERQKENFKRKYLDLTDILDRAFSHLESLANAKVKAEHRGCDRLLSRIGGVKNRGCDRLLSSLKTLRYYKQKSL